MNAVRVHGYVWTCIAVLACAGCCGSRTATETSLLSRDTGKPLDPGSFATLDPDKRLDIVAGFERMLEEQRQQAAAAAAAASKPVVVTPEGPAQPAPQVPKEPARSVEIAPVAEGGPGEPDGTSSAPAPTTAESIRVTYPLITASAGQVVARVEPRVQPAGSASGLQFAVAPGRDAPIWLRLDPNSGAIDSEIPVPSNARTAGFLVDVLRGGKKVAQSAVAVALVPQ